MPDEPRLEEQFLSQGAEKIVSDQLNEVEQIDINVRTDLFKIVQGQADAVSFSGQGLVMQEGIRVQEIKLQTDSISINPLSALFGQIELNEPVNAVARVVLTEADINRALSSDLVRSKPQNFELKVDGKIVSFESQEIQVFLPHKGEMEFKGKVLLNEPGNIRTLGFTARVRPRTHSQPIILESFNCTQGGGISLEVIVALMQKVKEWVNLPYYEWEDTVFCIKYLEVEKGSLTLLVEAKLKQIPSSDTLLSP
ncbi:DUF2993 domain-containing protein [Nostoc sp. UHCC 0302]|uniref:LmeA family phospholipid-binding protein n=1 Tax=Nostoc sp. UHCC 0302 TaxID=3134896 RepID=UPI00311CA9CC